MTQTIDKRTVDSALSYFESELTRLDTDVIKPLADFTWSRDIPTTNLALSDRAFAYDEMTGTGVDQSISWANPNQTESPAVGVRYKRTSTGTNLWAQEIRKTIFELDDASRLGRQLESDLFSALNMKVQQDLNKIAYVGDTSKGFSGFLNNSAIADTGSAIAVWTDSTTNDAIISSLQTIHSDMYTKTRIAANKILLPFSRWSVLANRKYNEYGMTLLQFIEQQSAMSRLAGGIKIEVCHDCAGILASNKDRLVMYRDDRQAVVLPLSTLGNTAIETRQFHLITTYYMNAGQVTFKRPELVRYATMNV